MYVMLLILSVWPVFITNFCYFSYFIKVQTSISPFVDPVMMFGPPDGMIPTRGLKSTPHIFEGDFKEVIYEQNYAEFGLAVFQTFPSPLDPTVMYRDPFGAKTPLVTELASPYSVATFSKWICFARFLLKSSSASTLSIFSYSFYFSTLVIAFLIEIRVS